jgi:hypothetical protein
MKFPTRGSAFEVKGSGQRLYRTLSETKMGLKRVNENHQFYPPQALPIIPYPDSNYIRIKVKLRVTGNDSHIFTQCCRDNVSIK